MHDMFAIMSHGDGRKLSPNTLLQFKRSISYVYIYKRLIAQLENVRKYVECIFFKATTLLMVM